MNYIQLIKHTLLEKLPLMLILIVPIMLTVSCTNSLDKTDQSGNPINTAIIGISGNPGVLYGNGCSDSVIQVNTELVPDGTPVEFEITFSDSLPPSLRGCLFNGSLTVEQGIAFVNYLAGILVGIGEIATVNVAVTVNPIGGDTETDFITILLDGVGIIPPADFSIETPNGMEENPQQVFATLIFQTVGIKPGTLVDIFLSNPALGTLNGGESEVTVPVQGSIDAGEFVVEYTANIGAGGTQIITARLFLDIPPELAGICPVPAPEDILVEATVVITQTVADEEMMEEEMMEEEMM